MSDARGRRRRDDRVGVEARDAQHGEARRRIPAGELGVQRRAVGAADVQAVAASERAHGREHHVVRVHESAGGPAAALHLDDRRRGGIHRVRELIRERCEKVSRHEAILAETLRSTDHPFGYDPRVPLG